jgi:parallel beta-helix repeat protein
VAGNTDEGIDVEGKANKVTANTVSNNGGYGVAIVGRRDKTIGNTVTGSGTGADIAGPTCKGNVWKDNVVAASSACVP